MADILQSLGQSLGAIAIIGTALPLIPSGAWWIRIWDFPRLQLFFLALVSLLLSGATVDWAPSGAFDMALILLTAGTALYLLLRIAAYTPLMRPEVEQAEGRGPAAFRLLVANVKFSNGRHAGVANLVREAAAELVLLVEIDGAWRGALQGIAEDYPHRLEAVKENGCGIVLWSRYPLRNPKVRYIASPTRPSLHADIMLEKGSVRFVGLHPIPPGLPKADGERHDSDARDVELLAVAKAVAQDDKAKWLIAGDLNDVAWSPTTRKFKAISGLKDPRVGRGLFNTYHARHPLLRYPVDHVFVSPELKVAALERKTGPGSDHFAMLMSLDP